MTSSPDILVALANRTRNVAVVREAIGAMAGGLGLPSHALAAVKTSVSEAANNVVMHAYDGGGPLLASATTLPDRLRVEVGDRGRGLREPVAAGAVPARESGFGIQLMRELCDELTIAPAPGGDGTVLTLDFRLPAGVDVPAGKDAASGLPDPVPGSDVLWIAAGAPLGPVLGAVTGVLAVHAGLSIERLSDAQMLADTIAEESDRALAGERLQLAFAIEAGALRLRFGPLRGGDEATGGIDRMVRLLGDETAPPPARDGGQLELVLRDRR